MRDWYAAAIEWRAARLYEQSAESQTDSAGSYRAAALAVERAIIDLEDANGQASGTRVEIILPKKIVQT